MKSIFLTIILLISGYLSIAQQELMITQYMHNGLFLNPAYAGVHGGISASVLHRQQWVGIDGAPNTQLFTIHSPINFHNYSLGAVLYRDQIGISSQQGGYFSYAYRIRLGANVQLSMGIQTNLQNYATNYSDGMNPLFESGDSEIQGNTSLFKVNFGTGLFLHSDLFYVGISVPRILHQKLSVSDPDNIFMESVRHYYGSAGLVLPVGRKLIVKPNLLVKNVPGTPVQVDLNVNTLISNVVWAGLSYRSLESLDGLLGIQINPQLLVSYAYDFSVNQMGATSHEIMISYILERVNNKILTPRYF